MRNCIKRVLSFVLLVVAWIACNCRRIKRPQEKKHYLAICACFKNEAAFLKEWIEYHKLIGVDHFFLYNNESTDRYEDVLQGYISDGVVTLKDYPGKAIQYKAYDECIKNYHQDMEWLALIDLDEFICPKYDTTGPLVLDAGRKQSSSKSEIHISKFLDRFRKYPVLKVWWKQFGSGGVLQRDPHKLIIEQFVACEPDNVKYNWSKCILNMDYWESIDPYGVHDLRTTIKFGPITFRATAFNEIWFSEARSKASRSIQVNHYTNKSYDDFVKRKMNNGRAHRVLDDGEVPVPLDSFFWVDYRCTERDFTIQRFLTALKLRMTIP